MSILDMFWFIWPLLLYNLSAFIISIPIVNLIHHNTRWDKEKERIWDNVIMLFIIFWFTLVNLIYYFWEEIIQLLSYPIF